MAMIRRTARQVLKNRQRNHLLRSMPKHAICAEIGVWKGDFSARILSTTQPQQLHLIDPWRFKAGAAHWWGGGVAKSQADMDDIYGNVCQRFRKACEITIHRVKSADCGDLFPDEFFQWVYIDGDHSYDAVLSDLTLFFSKVKQDGYLAGDDLFHRGKAGKDYGVLRAVVEFVRTTPAELFYATHSQYIIKKIEGSSGRKE